MTEEMNEWGKRCKAAFKAAVIEWARHTDVSRLSEKEYRAAIERIAIQIVTDNPSPGWTNH